MTEFGRAMSSMFGAMNGGGNIARDILHDEARLSTQTKQIQLQTDINKKLSQIRQSANDEDWETEVNNFFAEIKSGMGNKNSPYYCRNNLQAMQFNEILEQNRVGVSAKVGLMAEERQAQKDIVNVSNAKDQLATMYGGMDYINKCNELDRQLYLTGRLNPQQYQQQMDLNFKKGYTQTHLNFFDANLDEAIQNGESYESYKKRVEEAIPEMKHKDINGLEIDFDKSALDEQINKTWKQTYYAKLSDIQQGNANKLSQIVQSMKQQQTAEGRLTVARQGQMVMNGMKGLQLSEDDRLKYAAYFDLFTSTKGSGSGSGSGSGESKPSDSYDKLCKAAPETAYQLWLEGKAGNLYDCTNLVSYNLQNEWFTGNYKENFGKDVNERNEDFNMLYKGSTSQETLTDAGIKMILEKYPQAKNLMANNFKGLITDMQKNPKDYGTATVGELANYMLDTLAGSNANLTDDQFIEGFKKHINDCYVEKCKFVTLDKKGKLQKTFDAKSPKGIAQAARLAQEKDFVYTYNGNEVWAAGKKEALEAKGGVVDVLKNAVVGTLGIPENERGKLDFYYKPNPESNDMQSTPIITYKNNAYEVIPNDDDKGFMLRDVHTGELIEGKVTGGKVARMAEKADAKAGQNAASGEVSRIENERAEYVAKEAAGVDTIPTAVRKSGAASAGDWQASPTTRQMFLQNTAAKIEKAADKVSKGKMNESEFREEFGISYASWKDTKGQTAKYELILKS